VANPVLGKLQGQGLIETTTAGLQQAGAQLATTPVGAAMQGRGIDSQKMAATQSAKINAVAANMRDVTSAALGTLRETGRMLEGQESAIAETARKASVLGRVDNQIARLAENKTLEKLNTLKFGGAQLDQTKLTGYDDAKLTALRTSIGDLIAGGTALTDSDITIINEALTVAGATPLDFSPEKLPSIPILAKSLSTLFTEKSSEEMQSEISKAILNAKAESTIGSLDDESINAIFDTPDKTETQQDLLNLLAGITGLDATKDTDLVKLRGMQLGELRSAIDSWKQSEFKDVGKLRKTLQDPMASKAQRQLALQELRRQGQIGVTGAEAKVNDLEKQMQDGDVVRIGNEEFTVDELFSDPAKLLQMQAWMDNPELIPLNADGSKPAFRQWLEANQAAIETKIAELTGVGAAGLSGAVARVKANADKLKLDESAATQLPKETLKTFFPEFADVGLDTQIPNEITDARTISAEQKLQTDIAKLNERFPTPRSKEQEESYQTQLAALKKTRDDTLEAMFGNFRKYKLLQNPATARNTALLLNNLGTIAGVDGKKIFAELTSAQVAQLVQSENAVNDFRAALQDRTNAKNFSGATNFSAEFKDMARYLGVESTAGQLANLAGKDLSKYKGIFQAAGLNALLTAEGKLLNTQFLSEKIADLKKYSLSDLLSGKNRTLKQELSNLAIKLNNQLGRVPQEDMPGSAAERDQNFRKANPTRKTAKDQVDELMPQENALGGENHNNWENWKRIFKESGPKIGAQERILSTYARFPNKESLPGYKAAVTEIARIKQEERDARAKWKDSERRFWDVKNRRLDTENRAAQIDKDYRDEFQKWFDKEQDEMQKRNKNSRELYAGFADLLGGIG